MWLKTVFFLFLDRLKKILKTFFFVEHLPPVFLVFSLGLKHSCPWPREGLFSEELFLALASNFFGVLGLEPCVLDSTDGVWIVRLLHFLMLIW